MNLGLLKELKTDEFRVALMPLQVKELVKNGHNVFVEENAGIHSGYPDNQYLDQGAIIGQKSEILIKAKLLLKIKAPLEYEYNDYNKDHIVFTYFHFDENILPEKIQQLIQSGFTGISYEWVEDNGRYPLLEPMSQLTGYLFAQKAVELVTHHKGILCGKYEDYLKPAHALIIGLGTIGLLALKYFLDNHLAVTILDKNIHNINGRINKRFNTHQIDYIENNSIICLPFNNDNPVESKTKLKEIIESFDIIVNCAVRRSNLPKSKLKYLIDEEMIKKMEPNSVICDTTACDKDLIETCISSEKVDHIDIIHDVIHYNCDHIPSLVGRSASELLTSRTFPFIMDIANKGLVEAIRSNKPLYNGIVCYQGKITHQYIAQKKGFEFYELTDLI
jgi:alanine dehydrogenase